MVNSSELQRYCKRGHIRPAEDLQRYVAVAWTMEWSLPEGQCCSVDVLPNPCVQIALGDAESALVGVVTGAFSARFTGQTFVFGLRFRPCGFHPFAGKPVSEYTDRKFPLGDVLPNLKSEKLKDLVAARESQGLLDQLQAELRSLLPPNDDPLERELAMFIEELEQNPGVLTVEDAARLYGTSPRTLQRLLRTYVGVTPKWLIRRYRLKEAAARAETGEAQNWAGLAQDLGYYDQSHLIRDFRRVLGQTPAAFSAAAVR